MPNLLRAALLFSLLASNTFGAPPAGTTTFEAPVEIPAGEAAKDFGQHAVTRLVDWDADGDLDLLIGAGDGSVWGMQNLGAMKFSPAEPIFVDRQPLRLGTQPTTACFIDMNGDALPDLVVAHSDVQVVWFPNTGSAKRPNFRASRPLALAGGKTLTLPKGCGGRIDARDWNGDGLTDLVAGAFSGPIVGYRNMGTRERPEFAAGVPLTLHGAERSYSYNVHPTLYDLNADGIVDVAYGMNWGTISFMTADADAEGKTPRTTSLTSPTLTTGHKIDLRELAGDDATPTFGDLDGDGTLDLVSGGRKGKIFWLRGVPIAVVLKRIDVVMTEHANDLGAALAGDEKLRSELIGAHQTVYRLCEDFLRTPESRREIRAWYVKHFADHSKWLKRRRWDEKTEPYVPSLAYQTWTVLMRLHEGDPDAKSHREFVAQTIGFDGRLKEILVDYGTLIIENGRATPNQLDCLVSYLSQIPPILLSDRSIPAVTEVITLGDYLGPRLDVLNAGGVNIFTSESGVRGSSENSFSKDYAPFANDYFGLVLAHELNHRVDATRFIAVPKYNAKYWAHMRKICGTNVKFQPNGIGVDWKATKEHFRREKLWNGDEAAWNTAWADYWLTGPGSSQTLNVCRNETTYTPPRYGIPFFLETRQESIASIANQYFSNSEHMLHFALDRLERGYPGCLDEWLLMVDVYSLDGDKTFLYRHDNGTTQLTRFEAPLTRTADGHVKSIKIRDKTYEFQLDADGLVTAVNVH